MKKTKYGELEKKFLNQAIDSDNLFYVGGEFTEKLVEKIKSFFKMPYAATASSGTAAIHCAIGALEIQPGKEIITSPITDMGSVIGALYQNLIPVFADVDPRTYNLSPDSIREKITDRTKAIIAVHLAGNPAQMEEILEIAAEHDLYVIEDCAQSYGAKSRGKYIGTMGDIGCYSLNAYKHISAGDGGFCITKDEELYERIHNFADKYYDRHGKGVRLSRLAPNYRITELHSAVALAQFENLPHIISKRHELGDLFNKEIEKLHIPISPHKVHPEDFCSYWFTMIRLEEEFPIPRKDFSFALKFEGVKASEGYISRPLYAEPLFKNKTFFPGGVWPAESIVGEEYQYRDGDCPEAEKILKMVLKIPINENMTKKDIQKQVQGIENAYEGMKEEFES